MWAILSLQGSTGWQASCADCPAGRSEPVVAQELVSRALPEPDGDIRTHKGVSHTTPTLTVGTARLTLPVSVLKNPELGGFPGGSAVKNPPAMQETQEMGLRSLGREDPLENEMATHSSLLAWETPWTGAPGGHSAWGCRDRQDCSDEEAAAL